MRKRADVETVGDREELLYLEAQRCTGMFQVRQKRGIVCEFLCSDLK